ncbi:MAG: hypothetical protein AAFV78_10160, partial [Bacteroidota bacterium]
RTSRSTEKMDSLSMKRADAYLSILFPRWPAPITPILIICVLGLVGQISGKELRGTHLLFSSIGNPSSQYFY